MEKITDDQQSNVIEMRFKSGAEKRVQDKLAKPMSFDIDPLEDLLAEFGDIEQEEVDFQFETKIPLTSSEQYKLNYQDSPVSMGDTLIEQAKVLREELKRLNYYLDEMNIEGRSYR